MAQAQGSTAPAASSPAVAFFDVDGTLVPGQAIWRGLWAYHFANRRRRRLVLRFFLGNLGPFALYKAGLLARDRFVARWGEGLALLFRGLTPAEAEAVFAWVWRQALRPALHAEVLDELRAHKERGTRVVLVSATLLGLLQAMAPDLGADAVVGSHLELKAGRHTGRIAPPLCFGPLKAVRVSELAKTWGVDLAACHAYADSAHDAPLLALVGHAVAVNPDPGLLAIARQKGWPVLGTPQK